MAHSTFHLEISQAADADLSEIYDYTCEQFGAEQAVKYLMGFDGIFESLCRNPKLGRSRNEITKGLRSCSKESHTVFYRILDDKIRIVRILENVVKNSW